MKTVLIVDDEKLFLASLTEGLQSYSNEFSVVTAANGQQAVEILQKQEIALVITDLKMPVMDGFQLLAFMIQAQIETPVIVMTAFGTPEIEDCIANFDACGYIEKPIDFQVLTDKIRTVISDTKSDGHLSGISLFSFLQLLQTERKTCTLKIKSAGRTATLTFLEGELADAAFGEYSGERAALEIVTWSDAEIEMTKVVRKVNRQITQPLHKILLEAMREKDERAASGAAQLKTSAASNSPTGINQPPLNNQMSNGRETQINNPTLQNRKETQLIMSNNLNNSISELMNIDGAVAVALVDSNSGMAMATAGNSINLDVAAAGNSEVVKTKLKVMTNLGLKDKIEDILISLGSQYHMIRPLSNHPALFFYVVLDRAKSNLAMARFKLSDVENKVEV